MSPDKHKPGPKDGRVKIEADWESAVGKALKKKRPKGGWPDKPDTAKNQPDPGDKSDD